MNAHWTERSLDSFVYRISSDFALQIENKMAEEGVSQSDLADLLGVTDGRVSQVLRNPGNLTLRKMIEYARSVKMKISVVAYDDNDPDNKKGPIHSEIFNQCWQKAGRPSDFFALKNCTSTAVRHTPDLRFIGLSALDVSDQRGTSDTTMMPFTNFEQKVSYGKIIYGRR